MTVQVNLKLQDAVYGLAARYAKLHGYRNIQDFIYHSIREKVYKNSDSGEKISTEEIKAIERLLEASIRKNKLANEDELRKALRE